MKRKCTACKQVLTEKNCAKREGGRFRSRCKTCQAEYFRDRYASHPSRKDQVVAAVARRREKLFAFVRDLKTDKPCMDCRVIYPYYVLDFDHRDRGTKEVNISQVVGRKGWSQKRILEEVNKCDLVCANCHRERTFNRFTTCSSTVEQSADNR